MAHEITLDKAIAMTTHYRRLRDGILSDPYKGKNILPLSETFDRSAVDRILAQEHCVSFRIYYGMDDENLMHAILVGVDKEGRDILPKEAAGEEGEIAEEAKRCPNDCPPESPLNG
ncbi:MAG: hypothetical protein JWP69_2047 [Flaviaesturariibacter sp.]|nr:hypothetical protein [Flaviaesturariibacter sp.]